MLLALFVAKEAKDDDDDDTVNAFVVVLVETRITTKEIKDVLEIVFMFLFLFCFL